MTLAHEELIDFILKGHQPEEVIEFKPSEAARQRVSDLIHREKTTGLTPEETSELDTYMHLEHIMRLAKAKARQRQTPGK
jgi:hypothetical protein